ncbi:hemin uptake protein HemP [Meridianimarinicoccus roseus]|jgi:hemin uptake protein HemP|uniref:Hemin uptake protein HemP n=1 Tax=Meridianimarinicoccus roseus TaxID=2072018 RepID=A0A2V2LDE8_9RHOB|nr:hemin uptake protein HemP [Meridianimarinicoccus roseus]PWR03590.1 hemin uptake protein HemP [Meridianimarinicoccus roseus]
MTVAFRPAGAPSIAAAPSRPDGREAPESTPLHDARRLTGPDRTARIVLDGQVYTLRITRAGKLILTK